MVWSEHDRVGGWTVRAERGQRAAPGPDGVKLVNLNCLFSPACFLHVSASFQRSIAVITGRPYNWRAFWRWCFEKRHSSSPTAPTLVPAALKVFWVFLSWADKALTAGLTEFLQPLCSGLTITYMNSGPLCLTRAVAYCSGMA